QRPGDPVELPAVLPAALPDPELRALRTALPGDGDAGPHQPRQLRDRRAAVARDRRLEARRARRLLRRDRRARRDPDGALAARDRDLRPLSSSGAAMPRDGESGPAAATLTLC